MAQVLVRNLEEKVKDRLRQRAVRNNHSMEEEIRDILRAAVAVSEGQPKKLGTWLQHHFAGIGLTEDIPEHRNYPVNPAIFD